MTRWHFWLAASLAAAIAGFATGLADDRMRTEFDPFLSMAFSSGDVLGVQ